MSSDTRFDALYDALKPRIDALEALRREARWRQTKFYLLMAVPGALLLSSPWLGYLLSDSAGTRLIQLSAVGLVAGIWIAVYFFNEPAMAAYAEYLARFKADVVAHVFKAVCQTAAYAPYQGIPRDVFEAPELFTTRGLYRSDDRVRGRVGATRFEAAEVRQRYTSTGKNRRVIVVFYGLFIHLDFNRALHGRTLVHPKRFSKVQGDRDALTPVTLDDREFDREYDVHASDAVEARNILTPALRQQVLAVNRERHAHVSLAFAGNRAYIAVHYGRPLFEPLLWITTSREDLGRIATDFALIEFVVRELDSNAGSWAGNVDESLYGPDEEPQGDAAIAALVEREFYDTDSGGVEITGTHWPRPESTRVVVEDAMSGTTVDYGLRWPFFVGPVLSIAPGAIVIAALRAANPFEAFGWLPRVPFVDGLVAGEPVVWLAGAALVGMIVTLPWTLRVRRVEVDASAVRITRGLSPFPRTYPRPKYGRILLKNRQLTLGSAEGFGLIRADASPTTLSMDEARWVAGSLRRALDATASGVGAP